MHRYIGTVIVCAFFGIVLSVAWYKNYYFPVYAISGEASAGTWLSGVLLTMCAATSLSLGVSHAEWRWYMITVFFLILAADEHFMFHEQVKESIIFNDHTRSRWVYELPVLAGTVLGLLVSLMLWQMLRGSSRYLLLAAVVFGTLSAGMDILAAGVLWEDAFKLLGELAVTCALLIHVRH
jgi:hypothetical protein